MSGTTTKATGRFDDPGECIDALRRAYVSADLVTHPFDLGQFVGGDAAVGVGAERRHRGTLARVQTLSSLSACSVELAALREQLGRVDPDSRRGRWLRSFADDAVALAAVQADLSVHEPSVPLESVVRHLSRSVEAAVAGDRSRARSVLLRGGEQLVERAVLYRKAASLAETVREIEFAHPREDPETVVDAVRDAVETGELSALEEVRDRIREAARGAWTVEDLLSFDPYEFEQLVGTLWAQRKKATSVTRASQDRGVDVVVERPDGRRVLIQAKRYKPGNTVGIKTVQRVEGVRAEFGVATALVVTSSSFTESARESAERLDDLVLVAGERLLDLLTRSDLVAPVTV